MPKRKMVNSIKNWYNLYRAKRDIVKSFKQGYMIVLPKNDETSNLLVKYLRKKYKFTIYIDITTSEERMLVSPTSVNYNCVELI